MAAALLVCGGECVDPTWEIVGTQLAAGVAIWLLLLGLGLLLALWAAFGGQRCTRRIWRCLRRRCGCCCALCRLCRRRGESSGSPTGSQALPGSSQPLSAYRRSQTQQIASVGTDDAEDVRKWAEAGRMKLDASFAYCALRSLFALLQCFMFCIRSYSKTMTDVGWLIDIVACAIHFIDWFFGWMEAHMKGIGFGLRFVFLASKTDCILLGSALALALPSTGAKTWLSFSSLAAVHLSTQFGKLLRVCNANLKVLKFQLINCGVQTLCAAFVAATTMMTVEQMGDPEVLDRLVEDEWNLMSAIYYVSSIVSTVGYGGLAPASILGRITAVIVVFTGFSCMVSATQTINEIVDISTSGQGVVEFPRNARHIIIAGRPTATAVHSFVKEMFHQDHSEDETLHLVLLLPSDSKLAATVAELLNERAKASHRRRVHIRQGSLLLSEDLVRVKAHSAEAVFLLPDMLCADPMQEDTENIMRCMSVRRYKKDLRIILLLMRAESRLLVDHNTSLGWEQDGGGDNSLAYIAVDEMKLGLVGKSCEVVGFVPLICNLVRCLNRQDEKDDSADQAALEAWRREYELGLETELYEVPLSDEYANRSSLFMQVVLDVNQRTGGLVYLIGLIETFATGNDAPRVLINPGPRYAILAPHLADTKGIFIAPALDTIQQCEDQEEPLLCGDRPPGMRPPKLWKDVRPAWMTRRDAAEEGEDDEDMQGIFRSSRHVSGAESEENENSEADSEAIEEYDDEESEIDEEMGALIAAQEFAEEAKLAKAREEALPEEDVESHLLQGLKGLPRKRARQLVALVKQKTKAKKPETPDLEMLAKGGHILFTCTGTAGRDSLRLGIEHFVRPLRQQRMYSHQNTSLPVVLLAPIVPADWENVSRFPEVFFLQGSPMSEFDLERVNARMASAIFICSFGGAVAQSSAEAWRMDAETVCVGRLIESMIHPDAETVVVAELNSGSNHEFLPIRLNTGFSGQTAEGTRRTSRFYTISPTRGLIVKKGLGTRLVELLASASDSVKDWTMDLMGTPLADQGPALAAADAEHYWRHPRFASGQLFVSEVLMSVAANMFFNPRLCDVISTMITSTVDMVPIPKEWVGRPFGELFAHMLWAECRFPVAIVRRARESRADSSGRKDTGLATSAKMEKMLSVKHTHTGGKTRRRFVFVLTAPGAQTTLLESDRTIVFAQTNLA